MNRYIDELSGLYNRRYLKEKEKKEIKEFFSNNIPFSMAIIDIDNFKEINDTLGHLKGDRILREVAQFLKKNLRETDTIIRYGGDEFIWIMPNTKRQDAEGTCKRILKRCRESEFERLNITISAGISSYPDDEKSFEGLLKIADESLYDAKRSGRDRIGHREKKRIEIPVKAFIDRLDEKDRLKKFLLDKKGGTRLAIVKGNVGIGKTRLVREVLSELRGRGILWANCLSFTDTIAYYSIKELIKYKIHRKGKGILKNIPLAYKIEIGKLIPEVMKNIESKIESIEVVLDKYRLFESIRKVMEKGKSGQIIIIDNIQWIDKKSIEVIKYLTRTLNHNPIIFILRREEETEAIKNFISSLSQEIEVTELELNPFKYNTIKEIIKSILGEEPEKELIEYIVRESGGNPSFIEEIMRILEEERYLRIEDEKWKFKEPSEEIVPRSIEDVAMRKYRNLSKEAQNVLEIASVVGWFDVKVIKEITGYNEGHIIGLIEDISRVGMTKKARDRIEFGEEICRNAIYKRSVAGIEGMKLHRRVGDIIEEQNKGREKDIAEELAFHYYRGQEKEKGIRYCIEAGDRAREKYANNEAIRYYTWAMELLCDEEEVAKVKTGIDCLIKRARVLTLIGNNDSAIKDLEKGIKESRLISDKKKEANAICKISRIYQNTGRYREAIKEAKKCIDITEEIEDNVQTANALNVIALACLNLTEYDKSMKSFRESLKISRQTGNREGEARVLNNIGIIYFESGELQNALKFFEDGLKMAKEIGNKVFEGNMVGNIGNVYHALGDYSSALRFYEDSLKIIRDIGNKRGETLIISNVGIIHSQLGEYKIALKFFKDSIRIAREIGYKNQEASSLNGIGDIYCCLGNYDNALKFYMDAREIAEQINAGVKNLYNLLSIGDLYLAMNEMKKAKEFLDKAYKIAKDIDSKRLVSDVLVDLGNYHMEEKTLDEVKKILNELRKLQKELKLFSIEKEIRIMSGRYYTEIKNYSKAEKDFKEALKIFKKVKEKLNIGKVNYYLGKMELERGEKSRSKQYLSESLDIFKSINANEWQKKSEKALKNIP